MNVVAETCNAGIRRADPRNAFDIAPLVRLANVGTTIFEQRAETFAGVECVDVTVITDNELVGDALLTAAGTIDASGGARVHEIAEIATGVDFVNVVAEASGVDTWGAIVAKARTGGATVGAHLRLGTYGTTGVNAMDVGVHTHGAGIRCTINARALIAGTGARGQDTRLLSASVDGHDIGTRAKHRQFAA